MVRGFVLFSSALDTFASIECLFGELQREPFFPPSVWDIVRGWGHSPRFCKSLQGRQSLYLFIYVKEEVESTYTCFATDKLSGKNRSQKKGFALDLANVL